MKVIVSKKRIDEYMVFLMLFWLILVSFLESFGIPHYFVFAMDALNLVMLSRILIKKHGVELFKYPVSGIVMFSLIIGIIVSTVNSTKPILVLWAVRNNMRYFVFFVFCVAFINRESVNRILRAIDVLYYLNFFLSVYEFFFLNVRQDQHGGIFGFVGLNGYLNILLLGVLVYHTWNWLYEKETGLKFLTIIGMGCAVAVFSELKIYFIEVAIIFMIALVKTYVFDRNRKRINKITFIGVCVLLLLILGLFAVGRVFPNFKGYFTISRMISLLTDDKGYNLDGHSINRLNTISKINGLIHESLGQKIFGIGLGAAEYSSTSEALVSGFYKSFMRLRYYWFQNAWIYIELGWVGLICYYASFIVTIKSAFNALKHKPDTDAVILILTGGSMCLFCMILLIYNTTLRMDIGYFVYFYISLLFISRKRIDVKGN